MGCDIHSIAQVREEGVWKNITEAIFYEYTSEPFGWRSYGMFGFLANVRNYSAVPCITGEARGLPEDYSEEPDIDDSLLDGMYHSHSWISLSELLAWDYDSTFEDRRHTVQVAPNHFNGSATAEPGKGIVTTYREFLCGDFFKDLEVLKALGAPDDVRIVFAFDN